MSRISKRYAQALFKVAEIDITKALDQLKSLEVVSELFAHSDANKVLNNPVMPIDLKRDLLKYALDKADAVATVRHTIDSMLTARRESYIPGMVDSYRELLDESQGKVRAEVISAAPLEPAETSEIAIKLGKIFAKKVEIMTKVEPSLLGGFVANVGNYRLDLSLKTKLENLALAAIQDTQS